MQVSCSCSLTTFIDYHCVNECCEGEKEKDPEGQVHLEQEDRTKVSCGPTPVRGDAYIASRGARSFPPTVDAIDSLTCKHQIGQISGGRCDPPQHKPAGRDAVDKACYLFHRYGLGDLL